MQNPIFLVANGDVRNHEWLKAQISRDSTALIGVDGGTNEIIQLGALPDIVLGDLDSVLPEHIRQLEENWVNIFRFNSEKDETDLELSLLYVVDNPQWADRPVEIFGAMGGRFDHELANVMLLTHPRLAERDIRLKTPHQSSFLISAGAPVEIKGRAGDKVSLIPLKGDATIKNTERLQWPLIDSVLKFGPARGVSNVMTASIASISVADGMVLCVHTESSWER